MKKGTIVINWGKYGGFYIKHHRICLGFIAFTYWSFDMDDVLEDIFLNNKQHE